MYGPPEVGYNIYIIGVMQATKWRAKGYLASDQGWKKDGFGSG
jgi:hypothetical protein